MFWFLINHPYIFSVLFGALVVSCVYVLTLKVKSILLPWFYLGGEKLFNYLLKVSTHEDEIQKAIMTYSKSRKDGIMISSPITQQFAKIILKMINAKKTLDIGVFTGYSSYSVAKNLPEDGRVYALEYDPKMLSIAKKWWQKGGVEKKIIPMLGKANDSLDTLMKDHCGTFDYAFIDADKAGYFSYYEKCLKLLKPGGVLFFDNTLWRGSVYNRSWIYNTFTLGIIKKFNRFGKIMAEGVKVFKKLNKMIHVDERVDVVVLPIDDGISMVRKK